MNPTIARIATDTAYRDTLRYRFLTDHFYAAEALGFTGFIRALHQPAVDLYFPKNPRMPIEEQHSIHYRMHLDPRHTFKTSLGKVDTAQWVAAFPELITILSESATQPLAEAISLSVAKFFCKPKGKDPTLVQALFPEVTSTGKPDGKWNTPNHSYLEMDSTLDFTSPKTSQSGWHPWIINPDDMVDGINSGIHAEQKTRQTVIDTYYVNKNLLRHGGFINLRGTRYHPFELYGDVLSKMNPDEWRVLIRGSLKVKSGARLMPGEFPAEDEVELIFPQLLSYRDLREKFYEDYETFQCQQQNDPQGGNLATFTEKLYETLLCAPERIPPMGETFICWRLPYGGKEYMARYAEGAAARVFGNRIYIVDAWQGQYTPTGLAEKIVRTLRDYGTGTLILEAIPGTEYLDAHLRNEAVRRNTSLRIQWLDYEDDDQVRFARMRQLEPVMEAGRISISTAVSKPAELRKQFLHFGLIVENGIVDCISRLTGHLPLSLLRREIEEEEAELHRRRREDAFYNMVFGPQNHGVMDAEKQAKQRLQQEAHMHTMETATNALGLPNMYGLDG